MNQFTGVQFQGTFHSYQQRVLDNVEQYLPDGKVNIVAAPGSGKTVLGLELIRRLGEPCLILSPTTVIREQWGQRFKELFLEDESRFEELFSTDLQQVKLVNSITYQALYASIRGINIYEDGQVKHKAVNVRRIIKKYKIMTICLDEAHHLKNEWQWALEKLKEFLGEDVKIISLSSTSPYDTEDVEWKRYYDLCGEIDEEIFVPELVAQGTLCPHQDYMYFSYPTAKETATPQEDEEHLRTIMAEEGKLESIGDIAEHEYRVMGKDLRMLVLTDDVRSEKEDLNKIGTGESFHTINTFSIFETLRRRNNTLNMCVLSGSLIILPQSIELQGIMMVEEPIADTHYSIVDMFGATHEALDFVSQLFREGKIQILIGSHALLAEGWDEPCTNSLILASIEDSHISINQMRGCANRADKNNPDKVTNIWHLVTPESGDLEVVKQRFDFFMGPNYETGEIESGIPRITLFRPPFNADGVQRINRKMLKLSEDREAMCELWKSQLEGRKFHVVVEASIPPEQTVPPFSYMVKPYFLVYILIPLFYACMVIPIINKIIRVISIGGNVSQVVALILSCLLFGVLCFIPVGMVTHRLLQHLTPVRSLKSIGKVLVKTLTECGFISPGSEVHVKKGHFFGREIGVQLRKASMHDQNTFNRALTEMLSPIEEPHFLLVRKKASLFIASKYQYQHEYSFACPTVLGRKRKHAEVLAHHMKKSLGDVEVAKTTYWILDKCRKKSFVSKGIDGQNKTSLPRANGKYIVVHEENYHEPI